MSKIAKNEENTEVIKEEVQLDADTLKEISDAVGKDLLPQLSETIKKAQADAVKTATDAFVAKNEEIKAKAVGEQTDKSLDDAVAKGVKAGLYSEDMVKESKEMRLFKAARALSNGDGIALAGYNKLAMALREKAGYANETTDADGAVLVPDPEFDTEVYSNLPKYGVAFQYADVRTTDRTSVYALSLDSGLEFYETAEAGVKRSAKLVFSRKLVELIKYAVIVPSTDELTEDAAIDFWNLVTQELTRAYAKKADEVTFTHATSGITNQAGVITHPVSGAGTTITWSDLLAAEGKGEDDNDTSGHRWFMRKETWYRLAQTKSDGGGGAGTGPYYFQPNPNQATTPWGTPVTFTRVLPTSGGTTSSDSSVVGANDAFAVYGNLRNYKLYNKRGMQLKILTEAIVEDVNGDDFNLATQDGTAMRAVIRMLGMLPKGNAPKFVVLGTGTVS